MTPRLPGRLLARCLPPDREDIVGDLEEDYRANATRWGRRRAAVRYWRDAVLIATRVGLDSRRRRRRSTPRPRASRAWFSLLEVRLGLRLVRKQPVLTVAIVLALSVGIGLATTGFTLLKGVMYGRLPFDHDGRFVQIVVRLRGVQDRPTADDLRHFREASKTLAGIGAFAMREVNLIHEDGEPEPLTAAFITPDAFAFLPGRPLHGRTLVAADGDAGAPPTMLVRQGLWDRMGGIGTGDRALTIGDLPRRIVGVVPESFIFPLPADVWIPITASDLADSTGWLVRSLRVFGILSPDTEREAAAAELQLLAQRLPLGHESAELRRVAVLPYTRGFGSAGSAEFLAGIVALLVLVLFVAATNVANLILARTAGRTTELAVRAALGARRGRLIGQVLVEVGLLGAGSALLGLGLSQAALTWGRSQIGHEVPPWIRFAPDAGVAAFVVGLLALTLVVAGFLPAWRVTRSAPAGSLAIGGAGRASVRFGHWSGALIITQLALSLAFLVGAGVFVRGLLGLSATRLHLATRGVTTARLYFDPALASATAPGPGSRLTETLAGIDAMQTRLLQAVGEVAGIGVVGATTVLPRTDGRDVAVQMEAEPGGTPAIGRAQTASATPGFFTVLGVRATSGRLLRETDRSRDAIPVAVVNRQFVAHHLAGRNPIGRRFHVPAPDAGSDAPPRWITIVGVIPDLGFSPADPAHAAGYYEPLRTTNAWYLVARSAPGGPTLEDGIRRAAATVHPDVRVTDVIPLARAGWETRALLQALSSSLMLMGGMCLLLALMSVYAIMTFVVTQRTREIGIRMALGATRGRVLRLVVGRAAGQIITGMTLGGVLAALLLNAMVVLPIRVPARDPAVLAGAVLLVAGAAVVACWIPAHRSARIQPTEALRCE